jgi:allophanate hydrolase
VAVPRVLGSTATYVRGGFGGHHGRRLQSHDILMLRRTSVPAEGESALPHSQKLGFDQPIRVVPGPQQDHFTDQALKTLLSEEYTVSRQSDRMGFRLDGPSIEHSGDYNIVSDGIVSGSIQVPGTGQPIILMVDNQTTGGYPKIATVISADIPVVGRRKPGQRLRFEAVDVAEAEAIRRSQEVVLAREAASILRAVEDGVHA